jgi:hypothetical protein
VVQEITQTKPNQTKLENFLSSQRKKERKKERKVANVNKLWEYR